jgi:hypothetical protein
MNNKYNDLKSINKWANIYWVFVALMLISIITLINTRLVKDLVNFVNANPNLTQQQYESQFNSILENNKNNMAMFNIAGLVGFISGMGIFVSTIVSIVQIISFNGKYDDSKYKAMVYSIFLLIFGMIPVFYIIVSVMTRKSAIEQEKMLQLMHN